MLGIKPDPMALLASRNYPGVKGQGCSTPLLLHFGMGQSQGPTAAQECLCTHQTWGGLIQPLMVGVPRTVSPGGGT